MEYPSPQCLGPLLVASENISSMSHLLGGNSHLPNDPLVVSLNPESWLWEPAFSPFVIREEGVNNSAPHQNITTVRGKELAEHVITDRKNTADLQTPLV